MADQPLWEVMDAVYDAAIKRRDFQSARRDGCAAELRAIADAVVPEDPEPKVRSQGPGHDRDFEEWLYWVQRMATRRRLLDEADRAERGEVDGQKRSGVE